MKDDSNQGALTPKYLTKDNPARTERDLNIITDAKVNGMTYKQLKDKYGLSGDSLVRIINDEDYKEILDGIHKREILGLARASERIDELIDHADPKVSLAAATQRMKNAGVAGNQTSVYINNLYQQGSAAIPPAIARYLDAQEQVIDAEYEVIDAG